MTDLEIMFSSVMNTNGAKNLKASFCVMVRGMMDVAGISVGGGGKAQPVRRWALHAGRNRLAERNGLRRAGQNRGQHGMVRRIGRRIVAARSIPCLLRAYFPLNSGGRFSMKARRPST
ncbi:MAG: hypothetical protein IIC13_09995 [SAR324 cluster bacterium]|nr:hypothetical protein [SAR324 cluster bacterium]MCH8886909.1 hypothetical protein [SAR324 cluster bacterium]